MAMTGTMMDVRKLIMRVPPKRMKATITASTIPRATGAIESK